jgi:hypothetical protein
VLTDRQLLWIVDHLPPSRYLMDWGVDIDIVAVERIASVEVTARRDHIALVIHTGTSSPPLVIEFPAELGREAHVVERLARRFTAAAAGPTPRRVYDVETVPLDVEAAERFGQGDIASEAVARLGAGGPLAAVLFSPRRAGQAAAATLALRRDQLLLDRDGAPTTGTDLRDVSRIRLVLSPLVGRLEVVVGSGTFGLAYPAPIANVGTAFLRRLRRQWANVAGIPPVIKASQAAAPRG